VNTQIPTNVIVITVRTRLIRHGQQRSFILAGVNRMAKRSKRRAWTPLDVRKLKASAKRKTQVASIARALKRTEGATRQKAFSLGLSLNSRAR
jgi:hypothetical protein